MGRKTKNFIYIAEEIRPSRFLVDLNKHLKEKLAPEKKENKLLAIFTQKKPGHINFLFKRQDAKKDLKEKTENSRKFLSNNLKRLAFFPLIKGIFKIFFSTGKLFYRLCYATGWLALFIVRFLWILILKTFKPFLIIGKFLKRAKKAKEIVIIEKEIIIKKGLLKRLFSKNNQPDKKEEKKPISLKIKFQAAVKPASLFLLITLAIIIPFKAINYFYDLNSLRGQVLGISEAAVTDMKEASLSASKFNFGKASEEFNFAGANFFKAKQDIDDIGGMLAILEKIVPNKEIKLAADAELILEAGRLSAAIGNNLTQVMAGIKFGDEANLKYTLENAYENIFMAGQSAQSLENKIRRINPENLPDEYKDTFTALRGKSAMMADCLVETADIISYLKIFLGMNEDKRYLLVFQNNAEMRGSGGFIGSYALVDLREGRIKKIETPGGGSYDTEAGLMEKIIAPEPLHLVNSLWHFWDANWWPDWAKSAKKLAWFYENSDGPSVDGVISITPTVAEKLLGILGPIDMEDKYNVTFTAENFWEVTQEFAEEKPPVIAAATTSTSTLAIVKHEPKKIIGDLINKISAEAPKKINRDNIFDLINTVEESFAEKQILLYFTDESLEKKTLDLDWGGDMKNTAWDYLMVANSNIAGGKSDRKIREEISHTSEIKPDGSVYDTLTIKRGHTGVKNEKFSGVRNVDWIRIYTPAGSRLIEASGFIKPEEKFFDHPEDYYTEDKDIMATEGRAETDDKSGTKIYNESGKTVFANWSMVDPGQTAVITLKYLLPFKIKAIPEENTNFLSRVAGILNPGQKELMPFALFAQKQPGSIGSAIESRLILPGNYKAVWAYPDSLTASDGGWDVKDSLSVDKYWSVLLENK